MSRYKLRSYCLCFFPGNYHVLTREVDLIVLCEGLVKWLDRSVEVLIIDPSNCRQYALVFNGSYLLTKDFTPEAYRNLVEGKHLVNE